MYAQCGWVATELPLCNTKINYCHCLVYHFNWGQKLLFRSAQPIIGSTPRNIQFYFLFRIFSDRFLFFFSFRFLFSDRFLFFSNRILCRFFLFIRIDFHVFGLISGISVVSIVSDRLFFVVYYFSDLPTHFSETGATTSRHDDVVKI